MKRNASRIISLILAAAMTVSCFTCTSFADETEVAEAAEVIEETAPDEAVADEAAAEEAVAEETVDEAEAEDEAAAPEEAAEEAVAENEAVALEAAEEAEAMALDEEIAATAEGDLGPAEAGKTYSVDFESILSAKYTAGDVVNEVITSEDNMIRYTGTASTKYQGGGYGFAVKTNDKVEVAVSGNAKISFLLSIHAPEGSEFVVTDSAGKQVGTLSARAATDKTTNEFEYKGGATILTFTYTSTAGQGYLAAVTVANDEIREVTGEVTNFLFWLDAIAVNGSIEPGVYDKTNLEGKVDIGDAKIELVGNKDSNGSLIKFTPEKDFMKGLVYKDITVNAYKAGQRNSNANNIPNLPVQGDGTAILVTPVADGMLVAYFASGKNIRIHEFKPGATTRTEAEQVYAESGNGSNMVGGPVSSFATNVKAGYTYVISTTGGTNDCGFAGVQYIADETATVSLDWKDDGKYNYSDVTVTFTDTDLGTAVDVKSGSATANLMKGHTYELSTDDGGAKATIGGSETVTIDDTAYTVDFELVPDVKLSGKILGIDDYSIIKSIKFVNMKNGNAYPVSPENYNAADGTYVIDNIKPGEFNTVIEADGYITKDRVSVIADQDNTDDIFVESTIKSQYILSQEIAEGSGTPLVFEGNYKGNNATSVNCSEGTKITVPVDGKKRVSVAGWYSGSWDINGQNAVTIEAGTHGGDTDPLINEYVTDGTETSVTINILANNTYLYWIKVDSLDAVFDPAKTTITVPGDFATLKDAVTYIKSLSDRPAGEEGRITIELTDDIQEQIVFDAPYITLKGNGHEINWYYGVSGYYYSIDPATGLYSESLFYDKYKKTEGNGSLWGGVAIVRGDYFRAENTIFRNTFNYEVTDKEIEDGAEGRGTISGIITKDSAVQSYNAKERSNAFYVEAKGIELYKCKVLSSQDSFGKNGSADGGYSVYVKDSVIGGNVDYICGEFKAVFENCELQWKTYGAGDAKNNGIGYIVAPKTNPYVFINCEVTVDDPASTNTLGKFGRTWGAGSATYFVNCETNGYIDNTGWGEMSNGDGTTSKFFEYGNTKNGESFTTSGLANSPQSNVLSEDTDAETISSLTGDEIYNDYLGSNFFGSESDKGIRGDVDENSIVTANDAAVLLAYITPGSNISKGNFSNYVADVAGIYNNPDDKVSTIDSADVALIFAKVLNSATEFNTPIEKPFYNSEEVTP